MAESTDHSFVIDASFALCFLLPDEQEELVTEKFKDFATGKIEFVSTSLFEFEVINSLIVAQKRGRIEKDNFDMLLDHLLRFRIKIQDTTTNEIVKTALEYDLTSYDASYVSLSKKLHIPLLTLDKKLVKL